MRGGERHGHWNEPVRGNLVRPVEINQRRFDGAVSCGGDAGVRGGDVGEDVAGRVEDVEDVEGGDGDEDDEGAVDVDEDLHASVSSLGASKTRNQRRFFPPENGISALPISPPDHPDIPAISRTLACCISAVVCRQKSGKPPLVIRSSSPSSAASDGSEQRRTTAADGGGRRLGTPSYLITPTLRHLDIFAQPFLPALARTTAH